MRLLAWPLLLPCARAIGGSFFRENTVEARSEPLIPRTGDGYTSVGYGVDVSFPMHHYPDPKSWGGVMYDDFMQGCAADYRMSSCKSNEESRMAMNRDQIPRQRNFTELGFAKIKAPQAVYGAARRFWDLHRDSTTSEQWPAGNTYVNHWKADSQMCSFEDRRFQPLGLRTKDTIWDAARPVLEAWVGEKLKPTSLYGIRVYYEDAILATHVDRLPLVTSAIINVDQDVDEPWPIEVVGHDGVAYNVTLEPGDMALYESHTVLHGRPFPLKGKFFANAFVHFIPVDPNDNSQNHPDIDFGWTAKARQERRDPKVFAEAQRRLEAMPKPPPHAVSVARARAAALKVDADRGEARPAPPEEPRREVAGSKSKPAAPGRRGRLRVEPRMPPKAAPKAEPGHQVHAGARRRPSARAEEVASRRLPRLSSARAGDRE